MATSPTITGTVTPIDSTPPPGVETGDPLPLLTDTRRQQLDGIVQQMMTNKEPDENISAVVKDFKQKYSAGAPPATSAAVPPADDALARTSPVVPPEATTFGKISSFAAGFDKQVLQNLNPITAVKALFLPVDTYQADAKARIKIMQQASQDFDNGNYGSAAIHALDGFVPVLGPMINEMGQAAASGDPERIGRAVGNLTSFKTTPEALHVAAGAVMQGAGAAADALAPARNAAAGALDTSAEKNISTALNPTTKVNKALVRDQIAPVLAGTKPLLAGGEARATTATSLKDLQATAQANMETHGQAIDDIFDQHAAAGTKLSPKPIIAALDAEKQNYIVAGVPINEPYVAKLDAFQDQIQKVSDANGGAIPLDDLRRIRQVHDEIVSQSKGGFALPPDAQSAVNASKTFGNAIRGSFADSVPELADQNKQFSFWSNVDKVTGDSLLRKTGQRAPLTQKLLEASGTVLGAHAGGPLGALVGQRAGGLLGQFQNSTLWNTLAAGVKSKLADLVETDPGAALALAKQNGLVPAPAAGASPAAQSVPTSGGLNAQPTTAVQGQAVPAAAGGSAPFGATAGGGGGPADTTVSVPGQAGGGYQAQYKLRELGDVNASHNGLTFAKNAEYKRTNDRDYANAVNQGKVVNWASRSEFDPKFHVTDNPDATNGPVVTDSQGNVIGGNGRAMIMQRVYGGNPKGAAAYRDLLKAKAGQFGVDPAAVDAMRQPILTREIPDSEFVGPGAKQAAVTDFNKPGTAALTPAERAVADSRRVSAGTLDDLAGRLDAKGEGATVADALEGKAGGEVLQKLVSDGVIAPQESAAFVNADSGELTPAGKARIGQLMIGRFFKDPAQMDAIAPSIRGRLERMAAPLAQVEGKPGWNLTPDVQAAVDLLHRSRLAKMPNLDDFIRQDGLFGKQKYSDQAVAMAKAMQNLPSKQLTLGARQYAADAAYAAKGTNTLMGDAPTPAESFAEAFERQPVAVAAGPKAVASASEIGPHGPIFREYTGRPAEAIEKLREGRTGEVPGAFVHPKIGLIDLIWGEEGDPANDYAKGYGLAKIIAKHAKQDPTLLNRLPDILQKGQIVSESENRIVMKSANDKGIVRLEFDGTPKKWLLTAYGPNDSMAASKRTTGLPRNP